MADKKILTKKELTKKLVFTSLAVFFVALILILLLKFYFFPDNVWIKDSRGIYVKYGNPIETPLKVIEQQQVIIDALEMFKIKKSAGMKFKSQCIGYIRGYSIDIVNSPRTLEDDLIENQCEDFRTGYAPYLLELSRDGEIIRIVGP
jgi:hypothetical protein